MYVETSTLGLLGPEILLLAIATLLFVGGAFVRQREAWSLVALVSYVVAFGWILCRVYTGTEAQVFSGPISSSGMSTCLRLLAIVLGIAYTLVASQSTDKLLATEYLGSLMLIVVGLMLVAGANELVLLFLGFELISIPTYVLLFIGRRDRATSEATMKYFFLSIMSSALLLFGLAFLFGMAGTTTIQGTAKAPGIREVLLKNAAENAAEAKVSGKVTVEDQFVTTVEPVQKVVAFKLAPNVSYSTPTTATRALLALAPVALVLILAGLGFKLTAAPFHFYAPDVYQGTTAANAGLLAVAPKIAGVVGIIRLVVIALPISADFAWQLALVLAIVTMTIGNVCALWQKNIRRLMAYSAIAHGGYLLLGLAAATGAVAIPELKATGGVTAMVFYVVVYSLASLGTFTALAYLGSQRREIQSINELAGLGKSQPLAAAVIAVCMFSMAGLPPLAGFWGKFGLFMSALEISLGNVDPNVRFAFLALLIIGALNAAIAAAYYLRLVSVMFFQSSTEPVPAGGGMGALVAATLCGALVVLAGVAPGSIMHLAGQYEAEMLQVADSLPVEPATSATAVLAEK
ncbi:NADH-quinone oxidoreductase subunit N [Anatilimnocola floriformis]|uniref:NADH-quinone oxidoreductase subunit N n=1 Tax=Anatilimnocola floriformis TaxID=2948575 RepID=UPI0020C57D85|nr:NADH-quinone oxidoreductase subunit N [Anatilimnocola floriformis]